MTRKKKKKVSEHKRVLEFLRRVRGSFHDSSMVYKMGGCYGLYQIVKFVFPTAQAYFEGEDKDHIAIRIDNRYYDIDGESREDPKDMRKLTPHEHEIWANVASGQRLELMLAKYQRYCNRVSAADKD